MIAVTLLGFHNLCSPIKKFANMRRAFFLYVAFHVCMLSAFGQVKVHTDNDYVQVAVGSGTYRFEVTNK